MISSESSRENNLPLAALPGDEVAFGSVTEPYRRELLTHCYRMLGSLEDAEDMVQETLIRAWVKKNTYEGRASLRTWLYKIATNACLDALKRRSRRLLPQNLRQPSVPGEGFLPPIQDPIWLEPFPDELLDPSDATPESRYEAHESINLAFLVALQELTPRQRAVLILCDVLDWSIEDVSLLLGATPTAINSTLYRARSRLSGHYTSRKARHFHDPQVNQESKALLDRYVTAWETADIDALVALLADDATFPMPPLPVWYQGRDSIRAFISTTILAGNPHGRWRLRPTRSNGQPAFAWYRIDDMSGQYTAYAIQVLTIEKGLLSNITTFGFPNLFSYFGLASVI